MSVSAGLPMAVLRERIVTLGEGAVCRSRAASFPFLPMPLRFLLLLFLGLSPVLVRAQNNWRADTQTITRENLWSVAAGGTALIAVGEKGTILYADYDGAAWQSRFSGTSVWLVGVAHGNGRWIAVGDAGTILVSDDNGDTWTPRPSGVTVRLNNVVYGDGRWLVVADQAGTVLTSTNNGETWSARTVPMSGFLRGLVFGQGRFVFGGSAGALFSTTDAATFTRHTFPSSTTNIEALAITPGRFFVSGSEGLWGTATTLDAWTINTASNRGTFRGLAARSDDDATISGDVSSVGFRAGTWSTSFLLPGFLVTAMTLGRDEAIAVGFGGGIARSSSLYNVTILPTGPGVATWSETSTSALYGSTVRLTALPGGSATNVALQWRKDNVDIPGATQAELTLTDVRPQSAGTYNVRATSAGATIISPFVSLTVLPGGRAPTLDPDFTFPFATAPHAIAFQPDGKILVSGSYGALGSTQYTLVRLLASGAVDSTFRADPNTAMARPKVLPDGRIYVSTTASIGGSAPFPGVARLQADGSLDAAFQPSRADSYNFLHAMADGRLYVGSLSAGGIVRLHADGSRDPNFRPITGSYAFMGVDEHGRVYLRQGETGGYLWYYPAVGHRFLADGTRDAAYSLNLTNTTHTTVLASGEVMIVGATYGRFGASHSYGRALATGARDVNYASPPGTPYPEINLDWAHFYTEDGSLWDFRREGSRMFARAYLPSGGRDPARTLELPDNLAYQPLAADARGLLYAVRRASYFASGNSQLSGPTFVRLLPVLGEPGRLTNLSVRAFVASADSPLIAGFVTAGSGETRALIRAIGPSLVNFGLSDVLPDPQLRLVANNATLATNDQWSATLAARFSALGAFPLAPDSNDAALETPIAAGDHSAIVTPAPGSAPGTALIEVYESAATGAPRRFINLSSRGPVSPGRPLIVGFAITGDRSANVLLRGVGPTLGQLGVPGALVNPKLTLYRGAAGLYENDNWRSLNQTLSISSTAGTGAFPLDSASGDAAILVTLAPGSYSVVVEGVGNTTGTALAEIYEAP